ncbi:autotransporter outer membrane beta-barrel domain-containing protein [Veillonella sp. DNF00869]|uniref:autotransporter outer membrane beta-barrel domain-containing protein n=1 Tax=Veillonella sp. DNF00869 TaxID=1384081 RepID=UPI000785F622|nr:autotransporter outer membrane beta-barrel domain-containing protein [Veillonella sp. DNF00869]
MRKKRLRYIILSVIAGGVLLTPAMANNYDSYFTNKREPVTYIVDGKANTIQLAELSENDPEEGPDGKHLFHSPSIENRFESRGEVTRYTRPNFEGADNAMSVNAIPRQAKDAPNDELTWGPKLANVEERGKDTEFNYVALQNGTTETVYTVNYPMGGYGNARLNVLEMFSGDNLHEIAAVNSAVNAMQNRVILRNVGRLRDVIGAEINNGDGSAIDNDVFVAGGKDIDIIYGAKAYNTFPATGSLKNNLVTLGAGKVVTAFGAYATTRDEEESFFQGKPATEKSKEVIGNRVQLGFNPDDKVQAEGRAPATVGQLVGGFSATNKANKNTVIIGEGSIGGLGMFKVKNEQSKHNVNGVDTNGIYTDENPYGDDNTVYKYFRQPGNYYIIGGMSDVEATGNTVDINKAEPFANKQVGIWGGHYILDGSTGDIKSGNTLNVNKVKGITLSHLANFENYNFDLPENAVNGDSILTVTDPHGTDVSNTKINVGVSGAAPVLHNGDSINLIYNSNGMNTTGVQYGKLQQGVSLSYDITAKAGDDKKSVVAVVKAASEETPTPEKPSTGDTTKPVPPVTPSTGDATKPVTPSTGNVPVKVLPQTKSLVETRTAVSGFINNGQDSITKAFANHTGETSPIIAGINHDRMKMETGSYANIKGSHAVLGLSKQSGRTYWGPFLEMGWARYDSHLDSGLRAEGNAKYYGVGMYAKTTLDNGVYVESSVRGGRTNYTYESNELVTASSNVHASYDAHNSYYGAHLGLGKVVSYGNHLEGNVYANVFYSHQGEANATLTGKGLGETYAFDSVNSVRTRLGYKVSKHMSNHNTWYLGVAYEREFSGEAHATVKGLSTLAPSLGGSSGLVEAGYTYGSNKDAFSATLNVEGWFGQKRGATLGGSINWKY